jgi:muramoyltetrapeptide carboxypeptidase
MTTTLFPGAGIAIVAPGGYAPDEAGYLRALAWLRSAGCVVHEYYRPAEKHQRFGATDAARAAQLHAAAANPEVDIVLALRGGYGMSRLLPMLDIGALASSGKLFVGHSDFTALQMAFLAHDGAASFAGPMVCDDFAREDLSDFTLRHFRDCLTSPTHAITFACADGPALDVEGMLWGGNLTMLATLVGTRWFPVIRDGILFIEDVNEHPYRVERTLLQLHYAGALKQKAIVLGDFSNYRLSPYDNGYDYGPMIDYLRGEIGVPILTGLPFGHIRDKATLAVGAHAHLRSADRRAELLMSGYPTLSSAA